MTTVTAGIKGDSGNLFVKGSVFPDTSELYDLGGSNLRWHDLYLSGNSIFLGDTVLTRHDASEGFSVKNQTVDIDGNVTFVPATLRVSTLTSETGQPIDISNDTFSNVNIEASNLSTTGNLDVKGTLLVDPVKIETPEVALSGNSDAGYLAVASSVGTSSAAYNAFDKDDNTEWASADGTYIAISGLVDETALTTSIVNTTDGDITGQYIELQLPQSVSILSYTLTAQSISGPSAFVLLGNTIANVSTDAWYVIDSVSGPTTWTDGTPLTRVVSRVPPFDAYRLLVTATQTSSTITTVQDLALFSSAKVVFDNAYVGIGTTAPLYPLHIVGDIQATSYIGSGAGLTSLPTSQLTGAVLVANGGTGVTSLTADKLIVGNGSSSLLSPADLHWDSSSNYLGIGTTSPAYPLHVEGKVFATDGMVAYSDARIKTNIIDIDGAVDIIKRMRGVRYDRTDLSDSGRHIGLIAQEVEEVVPEVVSTDANGMKSLAYANLVAVLIEAVKEQQKQIDMLFKNQTYVYKER